MVNLRKEEKVGSSIESVNKEACIEGRIIIEEFPMWKNFKNS